jgi:hypothetical protein
VGEQTFVQLKNCCSCFVPFPTPITYERNWLVRLWCDEDVRGRLTENAISKWVQSSALSNLDRFAMPMFPPLSTFAFGSLLELVFVDE